jgi:hypothetical protein
VGDDRAGVLLAVPGTIDAQPARHLIEAGDGVAAGARATRLFAQGAAPGSEPVRPRGRGGPQSCDSC